MTLRISFRCFWPGFDAADFFLPLVHGALGGAPTLVEPGSPCDIEFVSVFAAGGRSRTLASRAGRRLRQLWDPHIAGSIPCATPSAKARFSIWYSGENARPPVDTWDRTWTFEPDSELARNTYAPVWLMLLPELLAPVRVGHSAENRLGRELSVDELVNARESCVGGRPRFACMFTSRPDPARMLMARALSEVGEVDVFGHASGRPVPSKLETASQYRFMICPENDLYPGYVTEKAFDAWGAGCIPVWSGLDVHRDLNPEALLNHAEEASLDRLVERVALLEADRGLMDEMGTLPLLARRPSLDRLRRDVLALLESH